MHSGELSFLQLICWLYALLKRHGSDLAEKRQLQGSHSQLKNRCRHMAFVYQGYNLCSYVEAYKKGPRKTTLALSTTHGGLSSVAQKKLQAKVELFLLDGESRVNIYMQTTGSPLVGMELLKLLLLLCVSGCMCQRDCTGVVCPVLQNCIEEVLEDGACCASCIQIGCTCEGYQFYDCLNKGFRNGRVPEGKSYFVDFGSTECSCPKGGGRISCHFIPCPELPANCIEESEPVDGCIQCERIGCVYKELKYEAGHTFQMDPCQVCHCPTDGGKLMCYPIPDCDPRKVHKPMLVTSTEGNPSWRRQNDPVRHILTQDSRSSFSKPLLVSHGESLPPFKLNPHGSHMVEEEEEEVEEEDYDYTTTDSSKPSEHDFVPPTESSIISVSYPENVMPHQVVHGGGKQELKGRFGFHEAITHRPWFPKERTEVHFALHKDSSKKDTLSISKDETERVGFDSPKNSADKDRLPVFRDPTFEEQFSIDRDISERQSLGLYKENGNESAHDESITDSEGLAALAESKYPVVFDLYEDPTYSETVTDSPATVDQTTHQVQATETTTTWQTTRNTVSDYYSQAPTTESREHYSTQMEEDVTDEDRIEEAVNIHNVTDSDRRYGTHGIQGKQEENTVSNLENKESMLTSTYPTSKMPVNEYRTKLESSTIPPVRFSPTTQHPIREQVDEGQSATKESLFDFREEAGEEEEREERENIVSFFPKAHEETVEVWAAILDSEFRAGKAPPTFQVGNPPCAGSPAEISYLELGKSRHPISNGTQCKGTC
ncbi:uncharacterized protein [Hoplias malabaricus]|uniref:uncharacterized protein n=1 Tax=Hoplias malabaricus TaxID=27720 RepID=UPI0034626122